MTVKRRELLLGIGSAATLAALGCTGGGAKPPRTGPPARGRQPVDDAPAGPPAPADLFVPAPTGAAPTAFAKSPEWLRRAPALHAPTTCTAGSVLLTAFSDRQPLLTDRIRHFDQLPGLLDEAKNLGTSVLYLTDWYQGASGQDVREWWRNKGDYLPRSDMGGADALRAAIAAIHAAGGRVIAYVEPYIISKVSDVAQAHGDAWKIAWKPGDPGEDQYPDAIKMCPACAPWQEHLCDVARRMVGDLGFDGLFLDSWGNQKGRRCMSTSHGHAPGDPAAFDKGVLDLAEAVRAAMVGRKRDAVLLCEGSNIPALYASMDGSLTWGPHELARSPLWALGGATDVFTGGWSLDDAHQVLAMGHKLALSKYWLDSPPGASVRAWLDGAGKRPPERKDLRTRRFASERYSAALHAWRNAGILAGRPVPAIDDVTPRRWDRQNAFTDVDQYAKLFEHLEARVTELEAALAGVSPTAPSAHLGRLLAARATLSPVLDDGAEAQVVARSDAGFAVRFTRGKAVVVSAVNVSNAPIALDLGDPPGPPIRLRDAVDDSLVPWGPGANSLPVPPHTVRLMRAG